jgi:hypothetical protein
MNCAISEQIGAARIFAGSGQSVSISGMLARHSISGADAPPPCPDLT